MKDCFVRAKAINTAQHLQDNMLVFFRRNGSVQFIHQVKRKQDITIKEKSSAVRKYHKFTWPGDSEKTMRSSNQLPPAKQTT